MADSPGDGRRWYVAPLVGAALGAVIAQGLVWASEFGEGRCSPPTCRRGVEHPVLVGAAVGATIGLVVGLRARRS